MRGNRYICHNKWAKENKIPYVFKFNYSNNAQNWTSTGYHCYCRMHIFHRKEIKLVVLQITSLKRKNSLVDNLLLKSYFNPKCMIMDFPGKGAMYDKEHRFSVKNLRQTIELKFLRSTDLHFSLNRYLLICHC